MLKNKGFTLVELLVAMSIFMIIGTLSVGFFVTSIQLKQYSSITINTQQKLRTAMEIIARSAKEAKSAIVSPNGRTVDLEYGTQKKYRFSIEPVSSSSPGLWFYECLINAGVTTCANGQNLLGNQVTLTVPTIDELNSANENLNVSYFKLNGTNPASLEIKLSGTVNSIKPNPYFTDQLSILNIVLIEGAE